MNEMMDRMLKSVLLRNLWLIEKMLKALWPIEPARLEKHVRGKQVYYCQVIRENGKKRRKYVGKADSNAVRSIVADMVRRIRIEILKHNNQKIKELLASLQDDSTAGVLGRLPIQIREIADGSYLDQRMEELKAWARADYRRNQRPFPAEEHRTCDGTRVRSKGEVIWYNILFMMGIPFRYECQIEVVDKWGRIRYEYPDFLIQCYDGSFLIIEHLGMLWEDEYLKRQAEKIQMYLREGYVLGVNFFVTSDDASGGTSSDAIRQLAELVQERFYGYRFEGNY